MTQSTTFKFPTSAAVADIRVLHVRTVSGNGGGPEKTLFRSADYLPSYGVHAEAFYLLDAGTPSDLLERRAERSSMPVHIVHERSALDPTGPAALARLVRAGRFDVVHTHDYKSNTLARVLLAAGHYRIVATAHGYNQTSRREGYYYALERMLLRRADAVICPSKTLAGTLASHGVSRRKLHVIPNGIEIDRWPFRPRRHRSGPLRVLYVGRLSPEKNVGGLLDACGILLDRGRQLAVDIAGEGPQADWLVHHAEGKDLASHVNWLGVRDDVPDLMARADVLVNPSHTEAMPNTVLEALASGLPVIATDVGATGELVRNEYTGLLIPPDDTHTMSRAIACLDDDPSLAQSMAFRGRNRVERDFNFAVRMAHVVALYRGVLAAARRYA